MRNKGTKSEKIYHAVSLFSNCGAGDIGYKRAGFKFEVMAELSPKRLEVCLLNHPDAIGVESDLRNTWTDVVEKYNQKTDNAPLSLLAACPPCQGMSSARGLRGEHEDADAGSKDERNLLAVVIAKVAKVLNPKIIVVENVPEFLRKKVRHPKTFKPIAASNLLIELLEENYKVFPVLLDLCDFGVPQTRKRCFLTFIRRDLSQIDYLLNSCFAPYPLPTTVHDPISLGEALKNFALPSLDSSLPESAKSLAEENMHSVPILRDRDYKMISSIPKGTGNSAWQNNFCLSCETRNELPDICCKKCGKILPKPIVVKNGVRRLIRGFKTSYKRMDPSKPASTILTASGHISSHNTIHPYENRVLSTLECAYLQTLDDTFNWGQAYEKYGPTNVRAMIGEAVPPRFTQMHGETLVSLLSKSHENMLSITDERCRLAWRRLRDNQ